MPIETAQFDVCRTSEWTTEVPGHSSGLQLSRSWYRALVRNSPPLKKESDTEVTEFQQISQVMVSGPILLVQRDGSLREKHNLFACLSPALHLMCTLCFNGWGGAL